MTSNVVDCLRAPKAVNDVRKSSVGTKKLPPESIIEIMAPISGACVSGLRHIKRVVSQPDTAGD